MKSIKSLKSKRPKQTIKAMTYKEFREFERIQERSHMGPGFYKGNDIDFGKDIYHRVLISPSKNYDPPKDVTPDPGQYNPNLADSVTKPKVVDVRIVKPHNLYQRPNEITPDPGQYQTINKDFARNARNVMLAKPSLSPDRNLSHSRSCIISTPLNLFVDKRDSNPDPTKYQHDLNSFGREPRQRVTMNTRPRKKLWQVEETPGPGMYEPTRADKHIKYRVQSPVIHRELKLYQKPREISPDAGYYQKSSTDFCKNVRNITSFAQPQMRFFVQTTRSKSNPRQIETI